MKQSFFSGFFNNIAEILSRAVSLILVLLFYVIFFIGKGNISLNGLVGQGTLILGSVVLYELIALVFYELFSFVQNRSEFDHTEANQIENDEQDSLDI